MSDHEQPDAAEMINANRDGWCTAMDLRFVRATPDEVEAELLVGPQHLQAYGIVHGGVHCGIIETLASVGGALHAMQHGQAVVGIENHTSFIKAAREGERLRARATPLTRGRSSQLWEATVANGDGKVVSKGTVRVLCVDQGRELAGRKATP